MRLLSVGAASGALALSVLLLQPSAVHAQTTVPPTAAVAPSFETLLFAYEQQRINIIKRATRSVVTVESSERGEISGGTAFFVSSDGLLITNSHVVPSDRVRYTIETSSGREYTATVVHRDVSEDIALLRVNLSYTLPLRISTAATVDLGQTAIAIGNALGELSNTVSVGVVSGIGRSIVAENLDLVDGIEELDDVIQTDAAINAGNSGGPLLNSRGEVIGMNTAFAMEGQSIGFAIPAHKLRAHIAAYQRTQVRTTPVQSRPQ